MYIDAMNVYDRVIPFLKSSYQDKDEVYFNMFSPYALRLVRPYYDEERDTVTSVLKQFSNAAHRTMIVVGSNLLRYLDLGLAYCQSYIGVDPLSSTFINPSIKYLLNCHDNISIYNKRFEQIKSVDLPKKNRFFVFVFNVYCYIDQFEKHIMRLIKPGDIVFISTWNSQSSRAISIRNTYYDHLDNRAESLFSQLQRDTSRDFDQFELKMAQSSKEMIRHKKAVTDNLIFYF